MFGVANRKIFFQRLAEKRVRPLLNDDVGIIPSFLLRILRPNFAVHLKRQEIRARELRIFRILLRPSVQRFVGPLHGTDEVRIGGVRTCADRVVVERVVDAQVAHLHPAEVFIAGRRMLEHVQNVLLPFAQLRRLLIAALGLAALRTGFGRRARRWSGGNGPRKS